MTTRRYIVSYTSLKMSRRDVRHRQVTWAYSAREALFQIREPLALQERLERKEWESRKESFSARGERFSDFRVEAFPPRSAAEGMDCPCPLRQPGAGRPGSSVHNLDNGSEAYRITEHGQAWWHCHVHGPAGHWESGE